MPSSGAGQRWPLPRYERLSLILIDAVIGGKADELCPTKRVPVAKSIRCLLDDKSLALCCEASDKYLM